LAEEVTRLIHGDAGLQAARRATDIFFGAEISELSDAQLGEIFADVPSRDLARARLSGDGLNVVDALVEAELAKSKGEARRIVEQGGAYINNRRVEGLAAREKRNTRCFDFAIETGRSLNQRCRRGFSKTPPARPS
jgi:tyrosyl-tRNA synthetase